MRKNDSGLPDFFSNFPKFKMNQTSAKHVVICGFSTPPLKVDHHQPLKVDHHGGPCRIRSTFKGGCVQASPDKITFKEMGSPGRGGSLPAFPGGASRCLLTLAAPKKFEGLRLWHRPLLPYTPTFKSRSNATRAPVVIYF